MNIDDVSELAGGEPRAGYRCRAARDIPGVSKGVYCDGRMRLATATGDTGDMLVLHCTKCGRTAQIEDSTAE